jgi:catechol 2,3-dioxygenase-like lactoylglutathione lyase family enzyme
MTPLVGGVLETCLYVEADKAVPVESEVSWPQGGRSLYFLDPDGMVVELATPGLWRNY